MNDLTLIPFNVINPHNDFICNLEIEFDGLLGSNFLEHYNCVVHFDNRQLKSNFKFVETLKATDSTTIPHSDSDQ